MKNFKTGFDKVHIDIEQQIHLMWGILGLGILGFISFAIVKILTHFGIL